MTATVYLVDDDDDLRVALARLIGTLDVDVKAFDSSAELLAAFDHDAVGCLIADLKMPGIDGMDLFHQLASKPRSLPFIFLTGRGSVRDATTAFKGGAFDFIEKPFNPEHLLQRIRDAIEYHRKQIIEWDEWDDFEQRLNSLTPREREVLNLVVNGLLTKQIASQLNVAPKTIEVHRSNITKKMKVRSVVQLVRQYMRHQWIASARATDLPQMDS